MSNTQDMGQGTPGTMLYLLAIRGTLLPSSLEEARVVHNATAGAPASVAAAWALGDLSHMVYVPAGPPAAGGGEFLILDIWDSVDGLGQFFADPHVQEGGGRIFSSRDPVVWMPAQGFTSYHLPAPSGQNDRIVSLVRGTVASHAAAQATHNAIIAAEHVAARRAGSLSPVAYFRLAAPDSPEALEFFAVDVWMNAAGMMEYYQKPEFISAVQSLFTAAPVTSAWVHPAGDWTEW
jgi:hypothetical protein